MGEKEFSSCPEQCGALLWEGQIIPSLFTMQRAGEQKMSGENLSHGKSLPRAARDTKIQVIPCSWCTANTYYKAQGDAKGSPHVAQTQV